jgi:uncharacterized protein (DUF3084 family)
MTTLQLLGLVFGGIGGTAGLAGLIKVLLDHNQAKNKEWFEEAQKSYARVSEQCDDCQKKLQALEENRAKEIAQMRAELADVKIALMGRTDVVDEILAYVQGVPDEKMTEIRAQNRAARMAVLKSHSHPQ